MKSKTLAPLLQEHGVDPNRFGVGSAKTLDHLLAEINEGETVLKVVDEGLMRLVTILGITVYADVDGQRLRLVEDRQVFCDGRVRRRGIPTSLSEKIKEGESLPQAIARALREEIGCSKYTILTSNPIARIETVDSPSYPGLPTRYTKYEVDVLITSGYNPNGYEEDRDQITTHFVWC